MTDLLTTYSQAYQSRSGYDLATTLDPSRAQQLTAYVSSSNAQSITTDVRYATVYNSALGLSKAEATAWLDVYVALWKAGREVLAAEGATYRPGAGNGASNAAGAPWEKVYTAWKEVNNALILGYQKGSFAAWTIPCLYTTAKWLRLFAIRADQQVRQGKGDGDVAMTGGLSDDLVVDENGSQEKLEDAARQINRIFSLCISDRSSIEDSRKWGLYYITNLLFKTYFKLNQVNLCKNPLRSLQASASDMPSLLSFPKAHIVCFKYYVGVISFLEEDYVSAEEHLTDALRLLPSTSSSPASRRNHELILTYLVPTRLLTSHLLPTAQLLQPYPRLQALFTPVAKCIKRGDLAGFDRALEAGSAEFVRRRIYLTLERGRDIALRNLFRKVFIAGGYEPTKEGEAKPVRRTRVPLREFEAAVRLGMGGSDGEEGRMPEELEREEVECLIANMVYKNLMKGYIARSAEKVVLSKAGAFPGTGV